MSVLRRHHPRFILIHSLHEIIVFVRGLYSILKMGEEYPLEGKRDPEGFFVGNGRTWLEDFR